MIAVATIKRNVGLILHYAMQKQLSSRHSRDHSRDPTARCTDFSLLSLLCQCHRGLRLPPGIGYIVYTVFRR